MVLAIHFKLGQSVETRNYVYIHTVHLFDKYRCSTISESSETHIHWDCIKVVVRCETNLGIITTSCILDRWNVCIIRSCSEGRSFWTPYTTTEWVQQQQEGKTKRRLLCETNKHASQKNMNPMHNGQNRMKTGMEYKEREEPSRGCIVR